jgi:hypothetical protein
MAISAPSIPETNVLNPLFYGRSVHLPALVVFLAVIIGGALMRQLVVSLGDLARGSGRDEFRVQVAPLVDVLLSLRGEARREQRFSDADRLRAILAQCGVEVQDTPSGTAWSLAEA